VIVADADKKVKNPPYSNQENIAVHIHIMGWNIIMITVMIVITTMNISMTGKWR